MNDKYGRQMKKGVLDMLVLKLLEEQRKYGYQLIQELQEKSGGVFCLKEGTLYPILYRLEDEQLVESKWSEPEEKQIPRKYYVLTDKGREALPQIYQIWQQIVSGVDCITGDETSEHCRIGKE
ncbi:MAG: PadR family transcriptional regulator [Blautia sp.]|nr:PadR family transcriptional regulator [Lachnoclostridium sp.]MCM1210148.1 PadR family transcriptional regulator [Blautia sp.]